jgi:hypothetical protein
MGTVVHPHLGVTAEFFSSFVEEELLEKTRKERNQHQTLTYIAEVSIMNELTKAAK